MSRRRNTYKTGDRFNRRARAEGYRARSVFKLEEIQRRFQPLRPGARVLDLGCAPGSWSRFAKERVGRRGVVVGVDLQEVASLAGCTFYRRDVDGLAPEEVRSWLGGPADVVLSDMAPKTTGDRFGDHVRQVAIARRALAVAVEVLRPGGHFVCKLFEGEEAADFVGEVRARFTKTRRVRPEAVRRNSVELFVLGLGFKG